MKGFMRISPSFLLRNSTAVVILFDLIVQVSLIGRYLDNSVISSYAPTASDAVDYTNRAELLRTNGITEAFGDASRMPGYPLIILLMHYLFPAFPNLAVRLLQMFAVALSAGLIKIILQKYVSLKIAILASTLFIFLPLWHFVPVLIAEALTSVVVVILIYLLASVHNKEISLTLILKLSTCVAVATYLKPNNLLLLISVLGFIIFSRNSHPVKNISKTIFFVFLMLLPWMIFASSTQPGFVGLTTNSGANMYVGTGMVLDYDTGVLSQSAIKWKVDPKSNPSDIITTTNVQTPAELNAMYTHKAIQIWEKRPQKEIGYGIDKVLIAFGIKSNSRSDHILGIFSLLALLGSLILIKKPNLRAWGFTLIFTVLGLALQAAIFQADRRFVVPVFFPFATVCLGMVLGKFSRFNLNKVLGKFNK